jgi:hypothetical protein
MNIAIKNFDMRHENSGIAGVEVQQNFDATATRPQ